MKRKAAAAVVPLALLAIYLFLKSRDIKIWELSPQQARDYLLSFGLAKAAVIYLAVYIFSLRPFIPVPPTLMTIVGGFTFGPWLGLLLVVIGATLNASLSFLLARWLGKEHVDKIAKGWLDRLNLALGRADFKALLLIRLSPIGPPFDAVSYAAGLLEVHFRSFFFATAIGILPATFAYVYLGGAVTRGAAALLAGIFLVALVSFLLPWYLKRKRAAAEDHIKTAVEN